MGLCRLLLSRGASVHCVDIQDMTPFKLHRAIVGHGGHLELCWLLVKVGRPFGYWELRPIDGVLAHGRACYPTSWSRWARTGAHMPRVVRYSA